MAQRDDIIARAALCKCAHNPRLYCAHLCEEGSASLQWCSASKEVYMRAYAMQHTVTIT